MALYWSSAINIQQCIKLTFLYTVSFILYFLSFTMTITKRIIKASPLGLYWVYIDLNIIIIIWLSLFLYPISYIWLQLLKDPSWYRFYKNFAKYLPRRGKIPTCNNDEKDEYHQHKDAKLLYQQYYCSACYSVITGWF